MVTKTGVYRYRNNLFYIDVNTRATDAYEKNNPNRYFTKALTDGLKSLTGVSKNSTIWNEAELLVITTCYKTFQEDYPEYFI